MSTKAAASALALDSSAFATFQLLVAGFVHALSSIGVFDQMAPRCAQSRSAKPSEQ
jgi:hypothetical protein